MAVINCRNWTVFVERFIRKALNSRGSKSTIAGLDRKINLGNLAAAKLPFATDSNGLEFAGGHTFPSGSFQDIQAEHMQKVVTLKPVIGMFLPVTAGLFNGHHWNRLTGPQRLRHDLMKVSRRSLKFAQQGCMVFKRMSYDVDYALRGL